MAEGSGNPRTLADLLLGSRAEHFVPPEVNSERRPSSGNQRQLDFLFGPPPEREAVPPQASAEQPVGADTTLPFSEAAGLVAPTALQASLDDCDGSDTDDTLESSGPASAAAPNPADEIRPIWTVAALVTHVRERLEAGYHDLMVSGEISNCRTASSGHLYFTLRDGDAQLSAVVFRRQAQLLRFPVRDGMEVLARGRISIFEQRGQLQLIAETLEPRGTGSLQLAFEQLKTRLMAEGLFDSARKRPLPPFPQRIGVVTSTQGAVVHDIIKVIRRRHACLDLLIFPAAVQGPECPSAIAAGIRWFNRAAAGTDAFPVDLIVIARGGGSLEDLAGFNDESVARAIAASGLPVVSAVGHETDFTIADFVADLRAPTPSAAAELITATQHRIEERVGSLNDRLHRAVRYQTVYARQRFTALSADQILSRVHNFIERNAQRVDDLERRLQDGVQRRLQMSAVPLGALTSRLERRHPGELLRAWRDRLEFAERALSHLIQARITPITSRLGHAEGRLHALSPFGVLSRGYAMVYAEDGALVRDTSQVQPGSAIRARLAGGSLNAQVLDVEPGAADGPE